MDRLPTLPRIHRSARSAGGGIRLIAFRPLDACEPIPGLLTLGNLRLMQPSWPRSGAHPEDPRDTGRTARTSASLSRSRPADRLGRVRAGAISMGMSFKARLTTCPRSTFTASHRDTKRGIANPAGDRTRRDSSPTSEKPHCRGEGRPLENRSWGQRDGSPQITSRSPARTRSRKCLWPSYPFSPPRRPTRASGRWPSPSGDSHRNPGEGDADRSGLARRVPHRHTLVCDLNGNRRRMPGFGSIAEFRSMRSSFTSAVAMSGRRARIRIAESIRTNRLPSSSWTTPSTLCRSMWWET